MQFFQAALMFSSVATMVAGHAAITNLRGFNNVKASALAITETPRTGAGARPFQQDTSVIRVSSFWDATSPGSDHDRTEI